MAAEISKLAVVERGAKIADGVRVGAFSYIGPHVRIAAGCVIENNVTVTGRVTLDERNHIFPLAVIGTCADGTNERGEVLLGQANVIREHVTICAGTDQPTQIGTNNLIMIGCQIGGGAKIGSHGIFVNNTCIAGGAIIEDYVRTSGFIVIEPGVTVGAYTFTLGYAEIDRDAPPFAMVQGSPFRVRGVNTENLRRCGFDDKDIRALKDAFRELYTDDEVDGAAVKRLLNDSNPHVQKLAEFLNASQARRPSA